MRQHSAILRRVATCAVAGMALALAVSPASLPARAVVGTAESIEVAATSAKPAVRLFPPNRITFPMAPTPRCDILDSFGDARSGGRRHQGVDILATLGQPLYAVVDGFMSFTIKVGEKNSELSGNLLQLTGSDGTYYVYAHLSAFADGIVRGSVVKRGDVIGYVGDTGNPGPGNYHLHFEVHPFGGAAVDPLPMLLIPSGCKVY